MPSQLGEASALQELFRVHLEQYKITSGRLKNGAQILLPLGRIRSMDSIVLRH